MAHLTIDDLTLEEFEELEAGSQRERKKWEARKKVIQHSGRITSKILRRRVGA